MPYMVPNPDPEAGGTVKHPMYDGPGGKDLEASHVFASERNKMYYRGLQQRQSQSPQRFFKAGTHGQAFVRGTLGQVGARPAANDQNWSLIRMGMDARDQERKEQERSEDSRGHSDAGHT